MADMSDVVKVVDAGDGFITLSVNHEYLCGCHPDQEKIEAEAHADMIESFRELGRKTHDRREQAVMNAIIDAPPCLGPSYEDDVNL